jgi:putative transposase
MLLRFGDKMEINRKRVYRTMRRKRRLVCQRTLTPKPRVKKRKSVAAAPNERWAIGVTHIAVGRDGWAHLTAVIDCHDRELAGYKFALHGIAKEAERALEGTCVT